MNGGVPESEAPDCVVEFDDVSRFFGDTPALDSVSFTVRQGEFFSIIGPSGSGKTTTVRMIAGLEAPTEGSVRLFGKDVAAVPPHRRGTPMVFQSYALFPHLNIRDNVAYGPRMRGVSKPERRGHADDLLTLVGLEGLGDRRPEQLSGGQQQRVALARAIATEPRVVLLDEALGALDAALRIEMQVELKRLQKELACSFIHVTHDQSEAIAMADRILVLHGGRLEQIGTPAEVFARPKTRFVAGFVGQNNLMDATPTGVTGEGLHTIHTALGDFVAKATDGHAIVRGEPATLIVRADALRRVTRGEMPNNFAGTIAGARYSGTTVTFLVKAPDGTEYRMEEPESLSHDGPHTNGDQLRIGDEVLVGWDTDHAYLMQ
ncbi:MAG: ABC transporter ATP-binding protein [Acidimicrobiaceae bacterium]|nr:ABC transporter ATP-binding protein [Acidimicrobiaceae bacterium]